MFLDKCDKDARSFSGWGPHSPRAEDMWLPVGGQTASIRGPEYIFNPSKTFYKENPDRMADP